jgi:hypothetical protein
MADPSALPNWDFLQRGYDIAYLDPTTLSIVDTVPPSSNPAQVSGVRQYVFDMTPSVVCPGNNSFTQPPECDSSFAYSFQSESETDIIQISSDIQDANSTSISLSASDPGGLYSCSGSYATKSARQVITNRSSTASSTHAQYQFYELQIPNWNNTESSRGMPALSDAFLSAVAGLKSQNSVVSDVINVFGTHFAIEVLFGGIANLNFTLASSDVSTLTSSSLSLSAQASVCFEVVKAGGSISSSQNVSQQYKDAISNQNQQMLFIGGAASGSISNWEQTVQASPAPIEVSLQPLWNLPQLQKPGSNVTAEQLTWLQNGIIAYLEAPNYYLSQSLLNYGDIVVLQPVNGLTPNGADLLFQPGIQTGQPPKTGVQTQVSSPTGVGELTDVYPGGTQLNESQNNLLPPAGQASPFELVLVNPANPGDTSQVNYNNPICFAVRNAPEFLLDAEAGAPNQGGVALSSNPVTSSTTQWTIYPLAASTQPDPNTQQAYQSLAHSETNPTVYGLAHGDAIVIERVSTSPNPDDPKGFLQLRNDNNLYSNGGYGSYPIAGNSCFFRILLVSKGQ